MVTLVKIMPNQIKDVWELIENALIKTSTNPNISQMLEGILLGKYTCWAAVEEDFVKLIAITGIIDEVFLLLHTVYPYAKLTKEVYTELYEDLKRYARACKCTNVVFYTDNDKLVELAISGGGRVSKYVSIPV